MRAPTGLVILGVVACSSAAPPPTVTPPAAPTPAPIAQTQHAEAPATDPECPAQHGGMSIEGMLGTLPQGRVRAALRAAEPTLTGCFTRRLETVPVLAGRVCFKLRVGGDGRVLWVVPQSSTMGDRETEHCMQEALAHVDFGRPCGGEAEVTWGIELDGGPDARAATAWQPARLNTLLTQRRAALTACRAGGTAPLSFTLYAAPATTPTSTVAAVGAAYPDAASEPIVECVLREVRTWRVPSPGSWYARATFDLH